MLEVKKINSILFDREQHYLLQQQLVRTYDAGIITVSLNIPGTNKQLPRYHQFFQAIIKPRILQFLQKNNINYQNMQQIYDHTGDYLIIVLPTNSNYLNIKQLLLNFETTSQTYQLLDFDVYNQELQTISRNDLNVEMRKCYLCSSPAKLCARGKVHLVSELLCYIDNVIEKEIEQNVRVK
ncbi:citrate lyase holo-[acyl-carrier protein] synthase [Spiroplasma endosymbiont of Stenodema calcarata]|uniref:citrate lyase holo-[acyl-carrier protein] synthase n=1 Tax=Spiroplasma endosymbiont of Stenodema calcarata TaxID=3139328 RepID=UPI003CCAD455